MVRIPKFEYAQGDFKVTMPSLCISQAEAICHILCAKDFPETLEREHFICDALMSKGVSEFSISAALFRRFNVYTVSGVIRHRISSPLEIPYGMSLAYKVRLAWCRHIAYHIGMQLYGEHTVKDEFKMGVFLGVAISAGAILGTLISIYERGITRVLINFLEFTK